MDDRSQAVSAAESSLDITSATWPKEWRADWEVKEDAEAGQRMWHRSGLCFFFEFEPADEKGSWAWVVYNDDVSDSRLFELQGAMGEDAFNTLSLLLGRQVKALWQELGHSDFRLAC